MPVRLLADLDSLSPAQLEATLSLLALADHVPGPQAAPGERKVALARWGSASDRNRADLDAAMAVARGGARSPTVEAALWPHRQRSDADRMPVLVYRTGEGQGDFPLSSLFVDVELQREHRRPIDEERHDPGFLGARGKPQEEARDLPGALAVARRGQRAFGARGVVLVGMPGSGKSTLLKRQLLQDADQTTLLLRFSTLQQLGLDALSAGFIRRWAAREAEIVGHPGAADVLLRDLGLSYRFLLDGFDELARREDRQKVVRWLVKHELPYWREADFVLTTRRAAWEEEDRGALEAKLHTYTLLRLTRDAVKAYVRMWFPLIARFETQGELEARVAALVADYSGRGERLIEEVLETPNRDASRVERLVGNPLLLSVVCLIFREHRRMPRNRADLYEKCLEVLIYGRRMDGSHTGFRQDVGVLLLGPLAWEMQATSDALDSPKELDRAEVIAALDLAKEAHSDISGQTGEALLDQLVGECALLVSADGVRYAFAHLTFQEYLAFRHALREDRVPELARAAADPRWREPILLGMSDARFQRAFFGELATRPGGLAGLPPDLLEAMILEKKSTTDFEPQPFMELLKRTDARTEDLRVVLDIFRRGARKAIAEAAATWIGHKDPTVAALAALVSGAPPPLGLGSRRALALPGGPELALVWVPGGEFWMGASRVPGSQNFDAEAFGDESPTHKVRVSGYWLGLHPVTNAQYRAFIRATGHRESPAWRKEGFDGDALPVTSVDWSDATAFCAWLSLAAGVQAMLPTEALWEWAARGGDARKYPWGEAAPTPEQAVFGEQRLSPVGGRPTGESPCGAQDMAGNVWEWTATVWAAYVSGTDTPVLTYKNEDRNLPLSTSRVVRGGAWGLHPGRLRAAARSGWRPVDRSDYLGFRVCVLREPVR